MKPRKIFNTIIFIALAIGFWTSSESCKSTKRKGCGCGADLNRMYRPRR